MDISTWYDSQAPEIINGKKLICRSAANGNALLQREAERLGGVAGVECVTIDDIAAKIAAESLSQRAGKSFVSTETSASASLTLMTLINSRISELEYDRTQWESEEAFQKHIHRILTGNTAGELMRIINMIRMNKAQDKLFRMSQGEYDKKTSFSDDSIYRFKRLYQCLGFYTDYLKDSDVYDKVRILEEAVAYLRELASQGRKSVVQLPVYAVLDDLVPTKLEKEFLGLLGADKIHIEAPRSGAVSGSFVKAYGMADEIRYAANRIAGMSCKGDNGGDNRLYPGDVALWYTNSSYINIIRSVFASQNIGVSFVSGLPAAEKDAFMLFIDILEWLKNDCRYELLTKLILNRAIEFRVSEDKDIAPLSKRAVIRYFSDIGYLYELSSYERIARGAEDEKPDISFLKNDDEEQPEYNDIRMKKLAEITAKKFTADLVYTVSPDDKEKGTYDPEKLFERMGKFFECYCVRKGEIRRQFPAVRELIRKIKRSLKTDGKAVFTLIETDKMIRDIINGENTDAAQSCETVSAQMIGSGRIISQRKYNFIVGMSSDLMLRKTDESPVMYDAEIKQCFDKDEDERLIASYTGKTRNELINLSLEYLISTLPQGSEVFYSYPDYDPVRLCERSETDFYSRKLRESGAVETSFNSLDQVENPDFLYEKKPFSSAGADANGAVENMVDFIFGKRHRLMEMNESGGEEKKTELSVEELDALISECSLPSKERLELSTTGLEALLSCPMKYACRYVYKLKEEPEYPADKLSWLDSREKGLFFHRVMELYFGSKLVGRNEASQLGTAEGADKFDADSFDNAMKVTEDEFSLLPVAVDRIKREELTEMRNAAENYIRLMTARYSDKEYGYLPGAVEYRWKQQEKDDIIDLKDFTSDGSKKTLALNYKEGSIDRLDMKRESDGSAHFVISDYKTGRIETFIRDHTEKLVQHYIYKFSLENSMTEEKKCIVDRFEFHFPFDDSKLLYHYRKGQFILSGSSEVTTVVIDRSDAFELADKIKYLLADFVASDRMAYSNGIRVIKNEFKYDIMHSAANDEHEKTSEGETDDAHVGLSDAELKSAVKNKCRFCSFGNICGVNTAAMKEDDKDE